MDGVIVLGPMFIDRYLGQCHPAETSVGLRYIEGAVDLEGDWDLAQLGDLINWPFLDVDVHRSLSEVSCDSGNHSPTLN